jgi:hypothetical protein
VLSTPIRLMTRPFRGYRELASATERPSVVLGAGRFLFVVGGFITLTASGRFLPVEAGSAMVSFSWLPLSQAIGLAAALRAFAPRERFLRAYALYLESLGPWLVVFLLLSGLCLFAADPARPIFGLLAPAILIASGYSVLLVFALFRAALGLGRARAAGATLVFYVVGNAIVLGYYFAAGQLWPIMPW